MVCFGAPPPTTRAPQTPAEKLRERVKALLERAATGREGRGGGGGGGGGRVERSSVYWWHLVNPQRACAQRGLL